VDAAVFGLLLPFHREKGPCPPKVTGVLIAGTCVPIFFLSLPLEVAIRFFAIWQQHF
jgi:hypothetical protein